MDQSQLEEYRKRMQERYRSLPAQSPQPARPPARPPQPLQPIANLSDDERMARELQAQEDARLNEEAARRLQSEDRPPSPEYVPPRDIQREERLVDPYPMGYYNPQQDVGRPLLPIANYGPPPPAPLPPSTGSCFPESDKCCGTTSQRVILTLAAAVTVAIIATLIALAAVARRD